ncbi:Fe-S cluster assembly ATPase SufC [Candidatus Peregrinibacteria bacterium]|nr:Fe-S cluster assembly ATPase SufC [Candidatus Peregrinibacteria bacterium]
MSQNMLKISDLTVEIEGKKVLDGFSLEIKPGESHAIMGPNGSGKSTLCFALMGHPKYKVIDGKIELNGQDLLKMSTDARARAGIFLGFQYPREVAGITFGNFLRQAANLRSEKKLGPAEYYKTAGILMEQVGLDKKFIGRGVNEGFSGGEKKRAEIAQLAALRPQFAFLDEIDSGLDIDSLKTTAKAIEDVRKENEMGLVMITHYQRLLHHLKADFVHVMVD